MDALFKPGGRNPKINAGLSELRETRTAVKQAQLPSREWKSHADLLSRALAGKKEIGQKLQELGREQNRLKRIMDAVPRIAERGPGVICLARLDLPS